MVRFRGISRSARARVLAVAVIATLAVSGVAGASSPAAKKPKLSGPPIKIMTIGRTSGAEGIPEIYDGARAATEGINNRGGVGGTELEVLKCDTEGDPNKAADCGRKAISEGVAAVVGKLNIDGGVLIPILAGANIPLVANIPQEAQDFVSPVSFPIDGGAITTPGALAYNLAKNGGATRISTAVNDGAGAGTIINGVTAALKGLGLAIHNDVRPPTGTADYAPYATAMLEGGTDGVVVAMGSDDALKTIQALLAQEPDLKIGLISSNQDQVEEALGDDLDNVYANHPLLYPFQTEFPGVRQYLKDIKAAGLAKKEKGPFRVHGYASVMTFLDVAKDLPEVTNLTLLAALPLATSVRNGLQPPIDFSVGGIGGLPRVFNPCQLLAKQRPGKDPKLFKGGFINPTTGEPCAKP